MAEPRPPKKATAKKVVPKKTSTPRAVIPKEAPAPLVRREDLQNVLAELHAVREAMEEAVKTQVKAETRPFRRIIIALSAAFVLLLVALGGLGVVALRSAHDRTNLRDLVVAQQEDLTQRRIDACQRDNASRAGARVVAGTVAGGFNQFAALLIGDTPIDAELQAQIDAFQKNVTGPLIALANDKTGPFADRTCTADALDAGG